MKRVYIQQGETIEGKRRSGMKPIGYVCLLCREIEFDVK